MAKLGYTWYPKDWGNSEAVFQLNLTQRGLYRELIDLAMLNDNKTVVNYKVWSRKWAIEEELLMFELTELEHLNLIEHKGKVIFIPSCESRLNLVRGGSKGGKNSKPTPKPTPKPIVKPIPKGDSNQKKLKEKETKYKRENIINSNSWIESIARTNKFKLIQVKNSLDRFLNEIELKCWEGDERECKAYFINWINLNPPERYQPPADTEPLYD